MIAAEAFRDQGLDRLSEQLRTLIAEQPLGLRIDHLDLAGRPNHHHGARRRLDDLPKALFALAQRLFDIVPLVTSIYAIAVGHGPLPLRGGHRHGLSLTAHCKTSLRRWQFVTRNVWI